MKTEDSLHASLCDHIKKYEKEFSSWIERSKKIEKRYKDDREVGKEQSQFNILWSNVQTLHPALYASPPVPNVSRRFDDNDDLGRVSSQVIERAASYYIDSDDFDNIMGQTVLDRLLSGRGTAWVRYKFNEQITDDVDKKREYEDVVIDYVHWEDFGHSWGRTWQEVRLVWRRVGLTKAELVKRFGNKAKEIPLDDKVDKDGKTTGDKENVASIYEIWDKQKRKIYWISKSYDSVIEEKDDILGLKNFFPCPRPLYSTIANDNLIPSPDYIQYQDQAMELDLLTGRINAITKALKVAGVYDATAQGVEKMLSEGTENQLVPVENWAVLGGDKGGLKGVIDWFPVDQIIVVLQGLYEARNIAKQDLYEITGISDIIRGATDPNETLGAQELKGKYAGLRLEDKQKDVARFARDIVRIVAEIICEHFDLETIKNVSGIKLLTSQEKEAIKLQAQESEQPLPDKIDELMRLPTWEEVESLLRDEMIRCYKIDIETDSTIKTDQEREKQETIEFVGAVGSFVQQASQVTDPDVQKILTELLGFSIRKFRVARDVEENIESALDEIRKRAENPQPQPDPEMARMQFEAEQKDKELQFKAQESQAKSQMEREKMAHDMQITQMDMAMKERELGYKAQELDFKGMEMQNNREMESERIRADSAKSRMEAKSKVSPDMAMTDPDFHEDGAPIVKMMEEQSEALMEGLQKIAQIQADSSQAIIDAMTKPKTVIRDRSGRITGVK